MWREEKTATGLVREAPGRALSLVPIVPRPSSILGLFLMKVLMVLAFL